MGTTTRHPKTLVGRLDLTFHKVKDNVENRIFNPIEHMMSFNGQKIYQDDVSLVSAEMASKMSYRDVAREAKFFLEDFPAALTINQCVWEYDGKAKEFIWDNNERYQVKIAFSDGTKTHSQGER
ncbi:MAG: hypothetical protein ABFC12_05535 [Methanobacterium sp.]